MRKFESAVDILADMQTHTEAEKLCNTMALDNRGTIRHTCGLARKNEGRVTC